MISLYPLTSLSSLSLYLSIPILSLSLYSFPSIPLFPLYLSIPLYPSHPSILPIPHPLYLSIPLSLSIPHSLIPLLLIAIDGN
ncbi:MAG UNVERIFIED_CONTAM: hypothetical protein LVR29_05125 [Microcystis novacekii LVE1205-3]